MSLFFIGLTQKAFEKIKASNSHEKLTALYDGQDPDNKYPPVDQRTYNQDPAFAPYQLQTKALINKIREISHGVVDLNQGLNELEAHLLVAYQEEPARMAWNNQREDFFNEVKCLLEKLVISLMDAKENNENAYILHLLTILKPQFEACSLGTPFQEGAYQVVNNAISVQNQAYYQHGEPSLIDYLSHAPTLAYVYQGEITTLCNAFPPLDLNGHHYLRRPDQMVPQVHGVDNLNKQQVYRTEIERLMGQYENLLTNQMITIKNTHLIMHYVRENLLFPFERREATAIKLDDQPEAIFIDCKRKLEKIYVMIDKLVKENKAEALNTLLKDLINDITKCGSGFASILSEVVLREEAFESKINLNHMAAKSRTAAAQAFASEHIKRFNLHEALHTHVEFYYLTMFDALGLNPIFTEEQRNFIDPYFGNIINLLRNPPQGNIANIAQIPLNGIWAAVSDITDVQQGYTKYFNAKNLVNELSEELEARIRAMVAVNQNASELYILIRNLFRSLKVPEKMLGRDFIIESLFTHENDEDGTIGPLVDKQSLTHALKKFSVAAWVQHGSLNRTSIPDQDNSEEQKIGNLTVNHTYLNDPDILRRAVELPKNVYIEYVFADEFDEEELVNIWKILDMNELLNEQNRLAFLETIVDPKELTMLITKTQSTKQFYEENFGNATARIEALTKFENEANQRLKRLKDAINECVIDIIADQGYYPSEDQARLTDLMLTQLEDFEQLFQEITQDDVQSDISAIDESLNGPLDIDDLSGDVIEEEVISGIGPALETLNQLSEEEDLEDDSNQGMTPEQHTDSTTGPHPHEDDDSVEDSDEDHMLVDQTEEDENNDLDDDRRKRQVIHALAQDFHQINNIYEVLVEALQNQGTRQRTQNLILDISDIILSSVLTINVKDYQMSRLASLYRANYEHLTLNEVPEIFRPHLSYEAIAHYANNSAANFRLIFGSLDDLLKVSNPKVFTLLLNLPDSLTEYEPDELTTIRQHYEDLKLGHNLFNIQHSHRNSNYDELLVIDTQMDVVRLLSADYVHLFYHHNFDPLQKLTENKRFQGILINDFYDIIRWFELIASQSEAFNPQVDIYKANLKRLTEILLAQVQNVDQWVKLFFNLERAFRMIPRSMHQIDPSELIYQLPEVISDAMFAHFDGNQYKQALFAENLAATTVNDFQLLSVDTQAKLFLHAPANVSIPDMRKTSTAANNIRDFGHFKGHMQDLDLSNWNSVLKNLEVFPQRSSLSFDWVSSNNMLVRQNAWMTFCKELPELDTEYVYDSNPEKYSVRIEKLIAEDEYNPETVKTLLIQFFEKYYNETLKGKREAFPLCVRQNVIPRTPARSGTRNVLRFTQQYWPTPERLPTPAALPVDGSGMDLTDIHGGIVNNDNDNNNNNHFW